ncbi:hypothetical protein EIM44_04925 [Bibersteinia trehalosi]|uniref:BRCT domain-containing protein n=1 Tax=Bibersteinia trehalosi TaxID=47735 RepID=A0A426FJQ2_BIBTR|nr:BRCT domain-containing protein [Bibersteinia trehalosi]RRN04784.1 hypothetical protein EIM44_04925 [Bibersteinia trehalosi]
MPYRNKELTSAKFYLSVYAFIDGLTVTSEINKDAVLFFDVWLLNISENVRYDEDIDNVLNIREEINDYLNDKISDEEIISSLLALNTQIMLYLGDFIRAVFSIDDFYSVYFISFCKGLTADNRINQDRAFYLLQYLQKNHLSHNPFAEHFYQFFNNHYSSDEEDINCEELLKMILNFIGKNSEDFSESNVITNTFLDKEDRLNLEGKTVCFTGKFNLGSRKQVTEIAKNQGASVVSEISSRIDYLIVGANGSEAWIFQNYGRKIEMAKNLQAQGYKLKIISESDWNF